MTAPRSQARVILEVIEGPHAGQRLEFDRHDTILVGRGSAAQLRLVNDPHFSRHQFLLEVNPPDVLIRDLGSRNGTLVNGQKVSQCRLKTGDVIGGGLTRVRVTLVDAEDDIATADLSDQAASEPSTISREPTPYQLEAARDTRKTQSAPPPPPPLEGPLLDIPGYTIERKLGQGGMGVVYLGRQQSTGERVAVKIVVPESAAYDRAMNFFLREARVLSQLKHPNIVRFREMGMHLGQAFFVMEYVETVEWKGAVAKCTAAERIRIACDLVCQILGGLQYAHELGIVHRDLKPANLLLHKDKMPAGRADARTLDARETLCAKLADFGLAKNYENAGLSGMTHEGQRLGTIPFMAPEQVVSARDARPSVDIYSAGATLYNLVSGAYPYNFPRGGEPLLIVLEEPVVPLQQRCAEVPARLAEVVSRALAKKPKDRYPTADALRMALLPYAEGPSASDS
jgi:serine/threonine-protein kinase